MLHTMMPADLPLKFIEVLVGLGRPDAALALHRAGSSSSNSVGSSADRAAGVSALGVGHNAGRGSQPSTSQARILVELRLRYVHRVPDQTVKRKSIPDCAFSRAVPTLVCEHVYGRCTHHATNLSLPATQVWAAGRGSAAGTYLHLILPTYAYLSRPNPGRRDPKPGGDEATPDHCHRGVGSLHLPAAPCRPRPRPAGTHMGISSIAGDALH